MNYSSLGCVKSNIVSHLKEIIAQRLNSEDQQRLPHLNNLCNRALQIEHLGQDNFEHLLHVDAVRSRREHQRRFHCFGILSCQFVNFVDFFRGKCGENVELCAHEKRLGGLWQK